MARNVVADLKRAVPIEGVVGAVVRLKRAGSLWKGLCPFHEEKTPSFTVTPGADGHYYCFGCHTSGDVITFVMHDRGLSFREAVLALCAEHAVSPEGFGSHGGGHGHVNADVGARDRLLAALERATAFYEQALWAPAGAPARDELARRGISEATARACRLGYAPDAWSSLWDALRAGGVSPADAEAADLVRARKDGQGWYDAFRNRLVCVVQDGRGRVLGFSGRALSDVDERTPKYLNTKATAVFDKGRQLFGLSLARSAIRAANEAVLVEGNFDCVRMREGGFQNVVAAMGTAVSAAQATLLARESDRVVVLFDGDDAGRKASGVVAGELLAAGLVVRIADMPDGMDPDRACRELGEAAVRDVVSGARDAMEWVAACALVRFGDSVTGRARAATVVRDLLARMPDATARDVAAGSVAKLLGADPSALLRDARRRAGGYLAPPWNSGVVEAVARAVAHALAEPDVKRGDAFRFLRSTFAATPLAAAMADEHEDPYDAIQAVPDLATRDLLAHAYQTRPWGATSFDDDVGRALDAASDAASIRSATERAVDATAPKKD